MKLGKLTTLILFSLALVLFGLVVPNCHAQLSVETVGAVRLVGIGDSEQYGAGVVASYSFNKYVAAWGRALAYETPDNWGGSAIDEGSAGVEATLLRSANGKVTLSAVGAVNRDFRLDDWGIGVGGKVKAVVYRSLYAFGQSEYRVWDHQQKDILATFGLGLSF